MLRTFLLQGSYDECNKRLEGLEGMAGSNPDLDEGPRTRPRTGSEKSKRGKKESSIGKKSKFFH